MYRGERPTLYCSGRGTAVPPRSPRGRGTAPAAARTTRMAGLHPCPNLLRPPPMPLLPLLLPLPPLVLLPLLPSPATLPLPLLLFGA